MYIFENERYKGCNRWNRGMWEVKASIRQSPLLPSFCYNSKKGWGSPTSVDINLDSTTALPQVLCPAGIYKRNHG